MRKIRFAVAAVITFLASSNAIAQYTNADIEAYIDTYKELAINKMYEYKIPASITIAQGIFESAAGKSRLAVDGNNHFGIKCHNDWTGDTVLIDDDELQECFRKYAKPEDSYNDHSLFLKNRKRYSALFNLDVMDYPGWAHGLKAAGYATNPEYAPRLIGLIERFNLAELDTLYKQRLEAGYFKDYPNVHPEVMAAETETKPAVLPEAHPQPKPVVKPSDKEAAKNQAKENQHKTSSKNSTSKPNATPKNDKPLSAPAQQKPVNETPQNDPKNDSPADNEAEPVETGASEEAVREEKPTAITVFSARTTDFPTAQYPFTDRPVYENNKTFFVIAQKGDTYSKIASDVQSNVKKIKKFNDVSGNAKLKVGQVVYIEKKNKTGKLEYYKVVNAETLNYISQKNAVRLDKICKYNNMKANAKIKKGDVIKLKK